MEQVKVLVLKNKQILVSQLEEVAPLVIGDPNCKLIEPFLLNEDDIQPSGCVGYMDKSLEGSTPFFVVGESESSSSSGLPGPEEKQIAGLQVCKKKTIISWD